MNDSMSDTTQGTDFGSTLKSPFLSSPFGYYSPTQPPAPPSMIPPPMLPPPPPIPPLGTDSYSMILERQREPLKPFPGMGPESLPYHNRQEYAQLPDINRYYPNREFPPNGFHPSMRDMPHPSYPEVIPFADPMGFGYPMLPGRCFTYVEQYHFDNQPSFGEQPFFNKGIGSTGPTFGGNFAPHPRFDRPYQPQTGPFEQQLFGAMSGYFPDLQFCRYSGCNDLARFCEYSSPNALNGVVSYSETVNVMSLPSVAISPKSKTEHVVEQSADDCVLISKSKICSNQNYTSMFRQLSIKRTPQKEQKGNNKTNKIN